MNWESIDRHQLDKLAAMASENISVITISSFFLPQEKLGPASPLNYRLRDETARLLAECSRVLKVGGLLFIYGLPHHLPFWGEYLYFFPEAKYQMLFKYWIALEIEDAPKQDTLKPSHMGMLMFLKSKADANSPFNLNTATVRIPHAYCSACGLNVKDWGGKKHLMNPNGIAISDVWRDLPKIEIKDHIAPDFILNRIFALTNQAATNYFHIIQNSSDIDRATSLPSINCPKERSHEWDWLKSIETDKIYQGDCISFLNKLAALYPDGLFELAFADPPYNLKKSYDKYQDALAEKQYIDWCNQWLAGMVKILKPGGSLVVLNLPKWAIHHAAFLNKHLEFRHWIAWDALSDPRGKIMPAHYALLYYTKPGAMPAFNYSSIGTKLKVDSVQPPDSPQYCLRASCLKKRKKLSDDKRVELSDIWFDVHRIKHKRDRDAHPCQLPEKLMERILLLTTPPGGMVFDPFCGTGTTAIAAHKLGRHYLTIDLDPNYVKIATEKLAAMKQHVDLSGNLIVPRPSVKKTKLPASKREIEIYLQKLAQRLGREPSEDDIRSDNADMLGKIDLIYPSRLTAIKRCRVALKNALAS